MCYKTSLEKKADRIMELTGRTFEWPEVYIPSGHIDAFSQPNLHIIPQDNPNLIIPAGWGLVPDFINQSSSKVTPYDYVDKYKTFNARGEEMFEKRSYKSSAENQRCLILADGFFEPHHYKKNSQPFFCYLNDRALFMFAGLYTKMDEELYTASIITVDANDTFSLIHNQKKRMPLVLNPQFTEDWISDLNPNQVNEIIHSGFTNDQFKYHAVSNAIYTDRHLDGKTAQEEVSSNDPELSSSLF